MEHSSFSQRFVAPKGKSIDSEFPPSARIALCYLFEDLKNNDYLARDDTFFLELNRIGRITSNDIVKPEDKAFVNKTSVRLNMLTWDQVYTFCERAYSKLLTPAGDRNEEWYISLEEVREYFTKELNQLIDEENLAFVFKDGFFERRGRAQTQKTIERAGAVLLDPSLERVKNHFNKAKRFFDLRPKPDLENCIKESLCSLEAAVEILTEKPASKDFEKAIKQLEGNTIKHIPAPIAESMIKIYSYRGSGQGVAHAALQGNRVAIEDVELVLSLTADFITYLVNLFPPEEDTPF